MVLEAQQYRSAVLDATAYEDDAKEKIKGMVDNGDTEVGGRRVFTDAGQNALKAAASSMAWFIMRMSRLLWVVD